MKFNILPICMTLVLVACNKGKDVKVLDGGATTRVTNVTPVVEPTVSPDETKPAPDALPEAQFCDKGQIYSIDASVDKDLFDHDALLVRTEKTDVTIYFQERQAMKKEHLDKNKVFCQILTHVNTKRGVTHIRGSFSADEKNKVEGKTVCLSKTLEKVTLKNGEGTFFEIACTKADGSAIRVEDVTDAMGSSNITISGTTK